MCGSLSSTRVDVCLQCGNFHWLTANEGKSNKKQTANAFFVGLLISCLFAGLHDKKHYVFALMMFGRETCFHSSCRTQKRWLPDDNDSGEE